MKALSILALATVASAQTFIVDTANGPGTNFTDLPTAVASVPDGAVLLVRAGGYSGFAMSGKGITILGAAGVNVNGSITIQGTSPNQPVTLRQLNWPSPPPQALIQVSQCGGLVLLERILYPPNASFLGSGVVVWGCDQAILRQCQLHCTVTLTQSCTVIDTCDIRGENNVPSLVGANAVIMLDGSLQVSGATVLQGGGESGGQALGPGSGILVSSGSLRVLGGSISGGFWTSPSPLLFGGLPIDGSPSALRVAPRVGLNSPSVWLSPTPRTVMPQVTGSGAPIGGTLSAITDTEPGDLVILAVGLPGPAVSQPGIQDSFWLDPHAHAFLAIGTQQAGAPVSGSVTVPAGSALEGLCLNWQAACYGPVTGFQATNPVVTLVR